MAKSRRAAKRAGKGKRYVFTREDCRKGYRAALEKCLDNWDLYAWLSAAYVATIGAAGAKTRKTRSEKLRNTPFQTALCTTQGALFIECARC